MPLDNTTTRPVNNGDGGFAPTADEIAHAVWKATGGEYGGGQNTGGTSGGTLTNKGDWVTNFGNGTTTPVDEFDFNTLPKDPHADIKLVAEPEGNHPLLDLLKGDDQPHFANGGAEGISCVEVVAAVVILVIVLWAADDLSDGAVCDFLGWEHDSSYRDPDQTTGDMPSPADMLASLLGKQGIDGIDVNSPEITDILGKLSDNAGKVADLMGTLQGAAKGGDAAALQGALTELMALAGLDGADFNPATVPPQDMVENMLEAFGIIGGLEGGNWTQTAYDAANEPVYTTIDLSEWLNHVVYEIA